MAEEVVRPQAREAQLSTRVLKMQSQETDPEGQLVKLRQDRSNQ